MLKRQPLYLAAPLFTPEERAFNEYLSTRLEQKFQVFLPQRDGHLIPGKKLSREKYNRLASKVFAADIAAIRNSTILFAVLNGRTMDEGVCFEIGFAHAIGVVCVGYLTDSRVLLPTGMNPMIECSLESSFRSDNELSRWIKKI